MYILVSCNLYIYPRNNNKKGIKPLFVTWYQSSFDPKSFLVLGQATTSLWVIKTSWFFWRFSLLVLLCLVSERLVLDKSQTVFYFFVDLLSWFCDYDSWLLLVCFCFCYGLFFLVLHTRLPSPIIC